MTREWKNGGCHCGAVRFRVRHCFSKALSCNCSICHMKGLVHCIVPAEDFQLLQGSEALRCYTFNTGVAKHLFCGTCGIAPYYIPRSHPDGFDVNLRCVEAVDWKQVTIESFDGRHWENHIQDIEGYE